MGCILLDGNISVKVDAGDYTCYVGSANIASQYAIGSSNISLTGNQAAATIGAIGIGLQVGGGLLSSSASQSAATFMGLPIGGDYGAGLRQSRTDRGAALSSLGSSVMQLIPPVAQCAGSMTGNAATKQSMLATLTLLYYPPTDDTNFQSMYGHPVMKIDTPAAGYCQTRGFPSLHLWRPARKPLTSTPPWTAVCLLSKGVILCISAMQDTMTRRHAVDFVPRL